MNRSIYSSPILAVLGLLACVPEAETLPETAFDEEFRAAPRPIADDVGVRKWSVEPTYRQTLCPAGTRCITYDVNRDGKDDLLRFDQDGVLNPAGTLEVAYSNGWDLGDFQSLSDAACIGEDICMIADIDGDGSPELIRFVREQAPTSAANSCSGRCGGAASGCWCDSLCTNYGDCCADHDAICVQGNTCEASCGGQSPGGCWCDDQCTQYGDCCADYEPSCATAHPAGGVIGDVQIAEFLGAEGFFADFQPWLSGFCQPGHQCDLGDVDGNGSVDLVAIAGPFDPQLSGRVFVSRSFNNEPGQLEEWASDACKDEPSLCRLADINGDGAADLVELSRDQQVDAAYVRLADGAGWKQPELWAQQSCKSGESCQLADYDGDLDADLIAFSPDTNSIRTWTANQNWFDGPLIFNEMPCDPGDRCWTADMTGDGRDDLVALTPSGAFEIHPSQDAADRLDDHAMRLSMLKSDHERRRQAWLAEQVEVILGEAVTPSADMIAIFPELTPPAPPPPPTPSDPALPFPPLPGMEPWPGFDPGSIHMTLLEDAIAARTAAIEDEIATILASMPAEGTMLSNTQQRRWTVTMGKVVAARTALYAQPLGISEVSLDGQCGNAVLHDRHWTDGGVARLEGSYLARFWNAMRWPEEDDERVWRVLPALTGVQEGLRCLDEEEMASLEASYVQAVAETMQELITAGRPALAKALWDQALPIELILYDAVKYFTTPMGWRLLQARIEGTNLILPELPDPGSDFAAYYVEDNTTCSTIRCQLYKSPTRAVAEFQALTLDTLGVWLPDLTARGRLRRSSLYPERLLDGLVDLRSLGEGDCPLVELAAKQMICQSNWTCIMSQTWRDPEQALAIEPRPGQLGSPFTHFGTDRASLPSDNSCGSEPPGGALPPTGCLGPDMRRRSGKFSPDPAVDHMFECAMDSFGSGGMVTSTVDVEFGWRGECLAGTKIGPATPDPKDPDEDPEPHIDQGVKQVYDFAMTGKDDKVQSYGFNRDKIIMTIAAHTGASEADTLAALTRQAEMIYSPDGRKNVYASDAPYRMVSRGRVRSGASGDKYFDGVVEYNDQLMRAELRTAMNNAPAGRDAWDVAHERVIIGLLHELVHRTINDLVVDGHADPRFMSEYKYSHSEVHDNLGLWSCDPGSTTCRSGCGYNDARIERFWQCATMPGDPTPPSHCDVAIDYCSDRVNGGLSFDAGAGCGAPGSIGVPPMCLGVTCDGSSSLASDCCSTLDGGGGGAAPYPHFEFGPGGHPGDPDIWGPGGPGVPGGGPLPGPIPWL